MRVGVDIRWLQEAVANRALGGIGRYALGLLGRLSESVEVIPLASPELPMPEVAHAVRAQLAPEPVPNCWRLPGTRLGPVAMWTAARDAAAVRRAVRTRQLSLVHMLHQLSPPPRRLRCPSVATVHDLAYLKHPRLFFGVERTPRLYRRRLQALEQASRVIAVSHTTADDVTELLGIPPSRITVVHEAADPVFVPSGPKVEHPDPYFLHVGGSGPGKNLSTLLKALSALGTAGRSAPNLVVVGVRPHDVPADERPNLHVRPYVSDEELAAYYRGALALVYPSVVEGFGLPVLEAMACGAPVITSSTTATAEVAGRAALLLEDPCSVEELARQMMTIQDAPDLRRRLSSEGLARASGFRWEDVVAQTVAVYRAALRGAP